MQPLTYSQARLLKLSRYTSVKPCKRCGGDDRYISPTGYDECEKCKGPSSCARVRIQQNAHNATVKKKTSRIWK